MHFFKFCIFLFIMELNFAHLYVLPLLCEYILSYNIHCWHTILTYTHKHITWMKAYTNTHVPQLLPIFSNFLQGNFHLSDKLMLLKNRHQKSSNPKPKTSNDHNFWSIRRNPTFFGVLESSRQGAPFHTIHS
jgi:hypothetical protein